MKQVVIDGAAIFDRAALHAALQRELVLPDWYGKNLDALHDCLTDLSEPTELTLKGRLALRVHLGRYAEQLERVLKAAEKENPGFVLCLQMYR